ncbi:hypothetical protein P7B02_11740 [Caulobacter segnis]|uniref:hypothetical protein n=1 Tax=Caulobacter segnis TaxID=88688 RepID=UPI002410AF44|nr:hypothetical protein [Caulobacter segnis]MDG2522213.1 hypothetical protein [Caulobacter segnis]
MKLRSVAVALALFSSTSAAHAACPAQPADAVAVIGALHGLHAKSSGFSYAALRRAILDFKPDVLVLEVRPDELIDRAVTPGRPEYPEVIWPLLKQRKIVSVPMEPGGDVFKAMITEAGSAFETFRRDQPDSAKALSTLDDATEAALLTYWSTPARAHDSLTAAAAAGLGAVRYGLAGDKAFGVQVRWDNYMADRVAETVAAHPGRRVLVLGSWRNRERLVQAVIPSRLVDACFAVD